MINSRIRNSGFGRTGKIPERMCSKLSAQICRIARRLQKIWDKVRVVTDKRRHTAVNRYLLFFFLLLFAACFEHLNHLFFLEEIQVYKLRGHESFDILVVLSALIGKAQ
jgi:hypothetical protein